MKKINFLVTGSSGFIGFHLIKHLLSKNHSVLGLDSHNNYYSEILKKKRLNILKKNKRFIFKKIDISNKKKLQNIFKNYKPEIIFHLAGQPGVLYSFKNPKSYFRNNVSATKIICELSKKHEVKKFIFASSSSVYGDQNKFPIKENAKINPKNPYAITKKNCEKIIKKTFLKTKTQYMIYRFFTVYGPLGRPDMFIHKFLNSIKKNKEILLYNNGLNFRDFTYVDDLIKVLIKTIKKIPKNKILNICRSKPIQTKVLVKIILKIYGFINPKIINTGFVKGEMLKTHGSNILLKKNFKHLKFTSLNFGLKKTIIAYKKHGY